MTSAPTCPSHRRPRPWNVILGVLLVATFFKAWAPQEPVLSVAQAQVSNPAEQRRQLVAQARRTNELLSDIKRILESGKLHVRVDAADNQQGSVTSTRRRGK